MMGLIKQNGDQLASVRGLLKMNYKEVRNMNSAVYQIFEESRWVGYLNTALDKLQLAGGMDKKYRNKIYFFLKSVFNNDAGDWVFVKYSDEDRKGDIYRVNNIRVNGIPWNVFVTATYQAMSNIDDTLTETEISDMLWKHIEGKVIEVSKEEFRDIYYRPFHIAN